MYWTEGGRYALGCNAISAAWTDAARAGIPGAGVGAVAGSFWRNAGARGGFPPVVPGLDFRSAARHVAGVPVFAAGRNPSGRAGWLAVFSGRQTDCSSR